MTNRQEIVWLDIEDSMDDIKARIYETKHSVYPLCRETVDNVLGLIYVKDLLGIELGAQPSDFLLSIKKEPVYLPETNRAYQALEKFKENRVYFGIIVDEYGGVMGVITMHDIVDVLIGDISESDEYEYEITDRGDGSFLIDAQIPFDDFTQYFELSLMETERKELAGFNTLGGFVLHILEDIPETGEKFEWKNFTFEVVDMDKNRIDKILVTQHEAE